MQFYNQKEFQLEYARQIYKYLIIKYRNKTVTHAMKMGKPHVRKAGWMNIQKMYLILVQFQYVIHLVLYMVFVEDRKYVIVKLAGK